MFEKSKEKRRIKKERKKIKPGRLKKIVANDTEIQALNIRIYNEGEDGIIKLAVKDQCEALHYDTVHFLIESEDKKLKIRAKFKNADEEKNFYVYTFIIEDFREFFA